MLLPNSDFVVLGVAHRSQLYLFCDLFGDLRSDQATHSR